MAGRKGTDVSGDPTRELITEGKMTYVTHGTHTEKD